MAEGYGVCNDPAGNAYLTGQASSSAIIGSSTVNPGIILIKYDPNGNLLWLKNFACQMGAYGFDICCDKNGNVFLAGAYGSSITIGSNTYTTAGAGAILIKLNSSGTILWSNVYNGSPSASGSGVSTDPAGIYFFTFKGNSQTRTIKVIKAAN